MYQDFSSLPPDQEREFIVFEQRSRESAKAALTIGVVVAAIYGLLTVVVVFSHEKPKPLIEADDLGASSVLSDVSREPPAPPPAAVPAAEPVGEAPATDPSAEPPAAPETAHEQAAGAIEPPPPPPGATKAPPTALVGQ
jgi:hypothetical protein